ncbi:MAG: asparagine synthetase B, partial [Bacteroidia bacterium]|nr:asparagine synthetase B [Bacteroidia bacterium]
MCGINGIISDRNELDLKDRIVRMNQSLAHRGPDAQGLFCKDGFGFGHTRLSILDLSENGSQPMISLDSRYVISFNGEVYNFEELRKKVKDYPFKSNTDTEVVLALFSKFGLDMVDTLEGMFAISIFDKVSQVLYLIRDRLGQKPIYYFKNEQGFGFSSEMRALLSSGLIRGELSRQGLENFIATKTVFEPNTILKNIYMVPKAS